MNGTTINPTSYKTGFVGWIRTPGRRWRQVTTGLVYDDVLAALLQVPSAGRTDRVVLKAGDDPNRPRPRSNR
jgi:hypothetical protein